MAEALLFSIAKTLLSNLGSIALEEIIAAWGFEDQLENLKATVSTITDTLLDAEDRQVESQAVRGWLQRLRDAVYEADDLFDELTTVASRKEVMAGNKITKGVRVFCSSSNQPALAFRVAREIKQLRERLDGIAKDGAEFAFRMHHGDARAVSWRRGQTYSFVDEGEVIGRDDDKKAILEMLFDVDVEENVFVIPIVGVGGLGKTTLAQLVYNDASVEEHFELRLWVCVSDESEFDLKLIIEKILMSATDNKPQNLEIEQLQSQLRKEIDGKKYFLVLDDVWNENRDKWLKLHALLMGGRKGSRILVTTRSRQVARITSVISPYELKGLSEEKSWSLFEKMAFEPGQQEKSPGLVEAGKEIVKKCANVPLAIRTLAGLLYGKDESKWLSFKENELPRIVESGNNIMNILKLSYHHLWSPLKNCFAYCALFPKDYAMDKETLISLWMAEGFIIPSSEDQCLEEVGQQYFMSLLQKCFFQDVERDEWGNIKSCKMHDLLHDLAREVAGVGSAVAKSETRNFDKRVHHLSLSYSLKRSSDIPRSLFKLKPLRTFLLPEQINYRTSFSQSLCRQFISSFRCLRVLDLHNLGIESLPSSIGTLIHLRYLDLSSVHVKKLPNSIAKLHNLQTLKLVACDKLKTLPKDIGKLINLRQLDVEGCYLFDMPSGMEKLTALQKLSSFIVGSRFGSGKVATAQLSDLKALTNLKGKLEIFIREEVKNPAFESMEANLKSKQGLSELRIEYFVQKDDHTDSRKHHDEVLLEGLQPHPNLRKLGIYRYRGKRFPSWAGMDKLSTSLLNLVEIKLEFCKWCQHLPSFAQLPCLKNLILWVMDSLEYVETGMYEPTSSTSLSTAPMRSGGIFFPSLESLTLRRMENLKGWWRHPEEATTNDETTTSTATDEKWQQQQHLLLPSFQKLSKLMLDHCPNLTSMPRCQHVESLTLVNVNKKLSVFKITETPAEFVATSSSTSCSHPLSKLKSMSIDDVEDLISLPKELVQNLTSLWIQYYALSDLETLREVFRSLSTLRTLRITDCHRLRSLPGGMEYLTSLEELTLLTCEELDLAADGVLDDGMPWKALNNLRSLRLDGLSKMSVLPGGLQYLSALRYLHLFMNEELMSIPGWISNLASLVEISLIDCPKLKSLPEGIQFLTSLKQLNIKDCPGLTERCRAPRGADWPKIQHIPIVRVWEN